MANCPTIEGPCGGEEGLRKKKIYVHYQGRYSEEELTKIFWIEPQTTVEDFFKIFVQQMSFKADPKSFALVLESDDVLEKGMLYSRVENKQDCFVQDLIIMGGTTHPSETTKEKIKEVNGASMEDIDKFIQNRQYRKAKLCCEEILQHSPHDFTALEKLTLVLYLSKHYQEAVVVGERAFACEPTYSPQDIYLLVGRCWLENQDPDEAYSVFRRGIDLFEKNPITNTEGKTLYLNLKAELCRTLFILGRHQEAGALINELMTSANPYGADPQSNVSALLIYAEIAAQYDKVIVD